MKLQATALALALAPLSLVACTKASPAPPDAGDFRDAPTATSTPTVAAPATGTAAEPPAVDPNDFEDELAYGGYDAGAGDPSLLTKKPGYESYDNPRFGFSVDVPKALTAMPEPDNGDGMQWRLGNLVVMTASGMHYEPELGLSCPTSKNVTAHGAKKASCWATGKRDGVIYWHKEVVARQTLFSLRFQYSESLKAQMDAIVTHANASWSP
jgi:hypothetical protein